MAAECAGESWWMVGLTLAASGHPWQLTGSSAAWVLVAALAVVVAFCTWISHWLSPGGSAWGRMGRRSSIPGPKGWPLVGSLAAMGGRAHRNLAELAKSHARRRLMAFSLGYTRVVICSDPDVAREILNSSCFADRPIKESAYRLMFHRAIGFAPYGDYWRNLRKIAAGHLFAPRRVAAFEAYRQAAADSMVKDIARATEGRAPVRVREILQRASLNNVMRSVFGRGYDFGSEEDREARELADMVTEGYDLLGAFNWADHLPLLQFLDLQGIRRRCSKLVPRVYEFVQRIIDEHRADPLGDKADADFVDVLLSLDGDQRLSDADMVAVLWEMIFRGTDTVAILTEWALARMVLHPEMQAKARAELDRVVGPGGRVLESDITRLPYVQAIVKEVLRMHPPGPLLSWARLAVRDVHVGGHLVPAGTTAMVNMWSITHDPEVWARPGTFDPDRFVPSAGGEDVQIMGADLRLAPFGSGRRVCPGKVLGLASVHLWLATLLHRFQWLPSPHHPVDLSDVLRLSCEMQFPLYANPIARAAPPSRYCT